MKLISWNVNGLRAVVGKGFVDIFNALDADVFCLQETKLQAGQIELDLPGYEQYWNYAERKGYSGTAVFTRIKPLNVTYLINVYTPNSKDELARLPYRMEWEDDVRAYLKKLEQTKPVVLCGDLNVAHEEIDLKNPKTNRKNAGFSDEERAKMTELLSAGFIDTFRYFHPDKTGEYSWWSYRFNARKNNAGWRIDYFIVSEALKDRLVSASIHQEIFGSDHCPVELELKE